MTRPWPVPPYEIVGNLHLHTDHSDGAGTHQEVAAAAVRAGLDVIAYTDHNCWTAGQEGWFSQPASGRRVLQLMGEENHNQARLPEVSHLLCLGTDRQLHPLGSQPQAVLNAVQRCGGVGFLAHPLEHAAPLFDEPALPWVDWEVTGYTGIELWNTMSEFKRYLTSKPGAALAAFFPSLFIRGPLPETLALWDDLLRGGQRVAVIGGADAHANVYSLGPLRRTVFPYEYLFRMVNTHLLLDTPLADDLAAARGQVLDALRAGHAFVAYDLAGDPRGFRFTATGRQGTAWMGDAIHLSDGLSLHVNSPLPAELRLLRDGRVVAQARGRRLSYQTRQPGVFRVEAYRRYRFRSRGWVFTNPIYVLPAGPEEVGARPGRETSRLCH